MLFRGMGSEREPGAAELEWPKLRRWIGIFLWERAWLGLVWLGLAGLGWAGLAQEAVVLVAVDDSVRWLTNDTRSKRRKWKILL